jgi:uncharacterized protein
MSRDLIEYNWRTRVLARWGAVCYDHAWLVAGIALVVTAFFSYFAATIEINLGFLSLLEEDDPLVQRVTAANDNFGDLSYMTVGLTTPDDKPADKQRLIRYARLLAPKLRAHEKLIGKVIARVDLDAMMRWAPLFLDVAETREFVEELTERQPELTRMFADAHLAPFLTEMNGLIEKEIIEADGISDGAEADAQLRALDSFFATAETYLQDEPETDPGPAKRALRKLILPTEDAGIPDDDYFFFDHDRLLVLRVMPTKPADDYIFVEEVMAAVDQALVEVDAQVTGVGVLLAGNMPIMRDEHRALVRDMKFTTLASMVLVLLIFAVVFRKITDLVLIAVCLVAGLGITFGVTEFAIGYLSLLTAFFGAIMIGLGIDFAIHLISRYGEQVGGGETVRDAVIGAMAGAGPGILTGGATTAAAFLVLMIARFKGLAQLGFVSGAGILIMLVLMLSLLPALISLRDRRKEPGDLSNRSIGDSVPLGKLADVATGRPRTAGLVVAVLCGLAAIGVTRTSFNYDYRSLEPRGAISLQDVDEVERRLERSIDSAMLMAHDVEESRRLAKEVLAQPTITAVESISEYVPENQDEKNVELRKLAPVLAGIEVLQRPGPGAAMAADDLRALSEAARGSQRVTKAVLQLAILDGDFEIEDLARAVAEHIGAFADRLDARTENAAAQAGGAFFQATVAGEVDALLANLKLAAQGERLTLEKLPAQIRDTFVGKDGSIAVYAYPAGNVWNKAYMLKHNKEVLDIDPTAISVPMLFEEVFANIIEDFKSSVWFSLAAVFLLVILDFRRPVTSLLALVPLIVGALWMVGVMPLIGMQFNLVNVSIVPLILGIGIDNGVHILHRYRMERTQRVHQAVAHTGKAIMLSSLTTMAGFGMLGLATYVAIGTLGQLLLVGVAACFFTSVFVLPLILGQLEKRGFEI